MARRLVRNSIQSGISGATADGGGSATTDAYKQKITQGFKDTNIPGAQGYVDPFKAQFDALLGNATNTANTGYGNSLSGSFAGEGATALDLGATLGQRDPGMDPTAATQGSFDWGNVEANNPFSKAALLQRSYGQQQDRTTNGYAAQGQLFSGALQNARNADTLANQQGQDALYKALQGYLSGQAGARRNASVTRDNSINNEGLAALGTLGS